ncbi:MAG: adenylate/guanylate cyclase domain-containing protein [Rhizobiaceae bacterium]
MIIEYIIENFLRSRDIGALPEQVRATLRARVRANEVLVRMLQLGILLFFAFVYFVSPKTSPDEALEVVPIVLGVYFVLSVIGLIWAMRSELPDWAVYFSVLFDFALLFGLMISFHFQYMQPASFILKAPALLYIFIFIAIRAIRLEVRFVVAAGVVAALGWMAMIFYVIWIDPGDNMLTRSYVEYLTSNSILIGAEVDKIISIVAVTGILVLVVNGSNNLLISSVAESSAAHELSRFFDDSVAKGIRNSAGALVAGEGERRTTTIMNIDIRAFTKLAAELDASKVMSALSIYQGRILPIIKAHGGVIDKFMGDGIMATFGVDLPDSHCASMALNAAEAIIRDQTKWMDEEPLLAEIGPINIGIGMASGDVAYGAVGKGDRLEFTVIGSAVNLSAKLEKHNKVLGSQCIASKRCWDFALDEGYKGGMVPIQQQADIDGVDGLSEIAELRLKT